MLREHSRERQRKISLEAVGPQVVDLQRKKTCFIGLLQLGQFVQGTADLM